MKKSKTILNSIMQRLHSAIYEFRIQELVRQITPHLYTGDRILDVGCGFGELGQAIMKSPHCPAEVKVSGLEQIKRSEELISIKYYDGQSIPYPDEAFDIVILADVLHHERDPHKLLEESSRITKRFLIIKDHKIEGFLAQKRIAFMDWAANAPYGIPCLYRYNTLQEWRRWYTRHGLIVEYEMLSMRLYPPFVNFVFGGSLQYFSILRKQK